MYSFKAATSAIDVSAGKTRKEDMVAFTLKSITSFAFTTVWLVAVLLLTFNRPSGAAVNLYATPPLQAQFIADTTNQYNATITPSLFPNSFNINLTSKKASMPCPSTQPPTDSCNDFVYGFAGGMTYERSDTVHYLNGLNAYCSAAISSDTCKAVISDLSDYLVTKTSGIAVVPNPIP